LNSEIPYVRLGIQWQEERDELLKKIDVLLSSGQYILGSEVDALEEDLSAFHGGGEVVTLNSGTDALVFALAALGVGRGDEVITPPNSFVASTAAIVHLGARPIFVDVLDDQNIDPEKAADAVTPKTKAIMPVHLTGRMAQMNEILEVSSATGVPIVEDAAQAIGSKFDGKYAGTLGAIGCFSLHPLKNLNAIGDGGFLLTTDPDVAANIRRARNHGLVDRVTVERFGYVSRLDALKALVVRHRLRCLTQVIEKRRNNAHQYMSLLDKSKVFFPSQDPDRFDSFHTFVVQLTNRDHVQQKLAESAIGTSIHYPVPIHLQPASSALGYSLGDFPVAERQAGRILSLPINQFMTESEISRVCEVVNREAVSL